MDSVRIDKWLWAARFFKTRSLAKEALTSGKVKLDGASLKPSYMVKTGDLLRIRRGVEVFQVEVKGVSENRQSAPIAQQLYEETSESQLNREKERLARKAAPVFDQGRPDKKQRRQIRSFNQKE